MSRKGGALLSVLWISAALAAISLSVASSVRSESSRVETTADGLRASYLASGSIDRAIQWMIWGQDLAPRYWQRNKPRLNFSYASGDVVVEIIPESAKLNINFAGEQDLLRLVTAVTGNEQQAREIVAGIIDWRTPSPSPTIFDQYYAGIAPTFRARHASFEEIEELLLVRGMTPEVFYGNYVSDNQGRLYASGGLRDALSVWGGLGPFDINSVSPALMQAVGVPADVAAGIAERRRTAPYGSMGEVGFSVPRLVVGGGNSIFTLRATARLRRADGSPGEVVRTSAASIKLLDSRLNLTNPITILRYYDDAWTQSGALPVAGASRP